MFYYIILYTNGSPWADIVGAGLGAALLGLILYAIEFIRGKKRVKELTQKYNEVKAEAFIKSDRHGHGDYNIYLLEELKKKCNPSNFMNPYNYEKVRIANELYPRLLKCEGNNNEELVEIRKEAISKLGIVLSTSYIFEELCKICNPQQFMNPYNPTKVAKANELYSRVLQNKMNIDALEKIRDEARVLFNKAKVQSLQEKERPCQLNSSNDSNDNSAKTIIIIFVIIWIIVLMITAVVKSQS